MPPANDRLGNKRKKRAIEIAKQNGYIVANSPEIRNETGMFCN
jgi:hypothetical protein